MTEWQRCCKPYFPVGGQPVHSTFCEAAPREKLTALEAEGWREENLARLAHPTTKSDQLSLAAMLEERAAYREAHSDDADDVLEDDV